MQNNQMSEVRLDLFDGGTAAAVGGPADTGTTAGETQASPEITRRGKSGEYENVHFGKLSGAEAPEQEQKADPSDAGRKDEGETKATPKTLEERRKAFREMVNGEYKDVYTEETQRIINARFKDTKALEQQLDRSRPILDMLMQRYKIGDGDTAKLMAAIENDDAYWSEAADEAGMSVERYKHFQKLQRENAALLQEQRRRYGAERAQAQLWKWYGEAEEARVAYPGFDLTAEVKNPRFLSMLQAGVPVRHAYEVLHMEDIKAGVAQNTAQRTEKQVVDAIRTKGARPAENGTAAQSAFTVKDDISKLTRKDRAEIARRALRGEKISF